MNLEFTELMGTAALIADETLKIQPGEKVLVLTDTRLGNYPGVESLEQALLAAFAERDIDFSLLTFAARNKPQADMPPLAEECAKLSDVLIVFTSQSALYTSAFARILVHARDSGTRILVMPLGMDVAGTDDIFYKLPTSKEEFLEVADFTDRVGEKFMTGTHTVRLMSANGTDLTFDIGTLRRNAHNGRIDKPGTRGLFPFGTFGIGITQGSAHGTLVFDSRLAALNGMLEDPIVLTVENGYATKVEGGKSAAKLLAKLAEMPYPDEQKLNISEFGLGFNKRMTMEAEDIGECERFFGAAHIGIGANNNFWGDIKIPFHSDGIITNATVYVDGELVVKDGEYLV